MPFTIPLTEKQRASMRAMHNNVLAAQARVDTYVLAVIEGADAPSGWAGMSLTDEGLVLGDAPAAIPAPAELPA